MIKKTYTDLYNFFFNYPTPSNLTNVWNFGILSFVFLLIQIISGLFLSMYYVPEEQFAFNYIEYIMRDTYFGWYIRYVHSNGASFFFFFVYLHFFRSLYYFSYVSPKVAIWNTGVLILLLMIITAFTGYVLPWGQMSFWAATVITNMATAIPFFGVETAQVIWGTYGVSSTTLNRFYTVHFILPFVILFIMIAHFKFLHSVGSNNSANVAAKDDKKKFHPYYTWKDAVVVSSMMILYLLVVNASPNYLSHTDNYIPADYLATPEHIVPEWYFSPFYTILRSASTKIGGVIFLMFSILILFYFPNEVSYHYSKEDWKTIQKSNLKGMKLEFHALVTKRTSPNLLPYLFWLFVADFAGLGYIGTQTVEAPYIKMGIYLTLFYFLFFFSSAYIHLFNLWIFNIKNSDKEDYPAYHFFKDLIAYLYKKYVSEQNRLLIYTKWVHFWSNVYSNISKIKFAFFSRFKPILKAIDDVLEKPIFHTTEELRQREKEHNEFMSKKDKTYYIKSDKEEMNESIKNTFNDNLSDLEKIKKFQQTPIQDKADISEHFKDRVKQVLKSSTKEEIIEFIKRVAAAGKK